MTNTSITQMDLEGLTPSDSEDHQNSCREGHKIKWKRLARKHGKVLSQSYEFLMLRDGKKKHKADSAGDDLIDDRATRKRACVSISYLNRTVSSPPITKPSITMSCLSLNAMGLGNHVHFAIYIC